MSLRSRTFSRRSLLAGSAGLAVGALPWAPLLAAAPSRGFKIGALDGILGKHFNPAVFDVARPIGLDGVQVEMGGPGNGTPLLHPEVQKKYLAAAKRTGLEIASLTLGAMNDSVPLKSNPRAATSSPTASTCARPWGCGWCWCRSSAPASWTCARPRRSATR